MKKTPGRLFKTWLKRIKTRHLQPLAVPLTGDQLKNFFREANITVCDVGARGGPAATFVRFAPYLHLVICEPDALEAERLRQTLTPLPWRKVTIVKEAFASQREMVELKIAEYSGLSSLLDFNHETLKQYHSIAKWGAVAKTVSVPSLTLDQAMARYALDAIGVLKIDTQGTELEILLSGRKKVLPGVLAVQVEMEFISLYKGQPLFGEVHRFLEEEGFRLVDLKRTSVRRKAQHYVPYSKPELGWGHGLYFREKNKDGSGLRVFQKVQLAAIGAMFDYFDYALYLLEKPEVTAYLEEENLARAADELAAYGYECARVLMKRSNLFLGKELAPSIVSDKHTER